MTGAQHDVHVADDRARAGVAAQHAQRSASEREALTLSEGYEGVKARAEGARREALRAFAGDAGDGEGSVFAATKESSRTLL
jgi:hypothetical protein